MTPLVRLQLEKAAADCGFEMTPLERDGGLELRSARFPETVFVKTSDGAAFRLSASNTWLLDAPDADPTVVAAGYEALYDWLRKAAARARTLPEKVADQFARATANMPRSTEAERLVVERVGQNIFRSALLDYWQGRCCVTGLAIPELLRASHIKPWARCDSDRERLDVFNGLLLAPHLDALFDAGLMTVGDYGTVLISAVLDPDARSLLGITGALRVNGLLDNHLMYLAFHRAEVWRA
jgi:putative restriction endonuclease